MGASIPQLQKSIYFIVCGSSIQPMQPCISMHTYWTHRMHANLDLTLWRGASCYRCKGALAWPQQQRLCLPDHVVQTWLDHNNVLVGSKCNKLRMHHVPTGAWQEVPYPEQPIHRQGPDLLARANRAHAGQHGMSVSPSGSFLVTGATAAEDILLWRLQDASTTSSGSSGPFMQPVQTFMGHADWVFGLDWISDRHWVSGGRDGTIK